MAKQKKNSYRLTFTINNQRAQFTAHTQAEAASIRLHVRRLVSSRRTGTPALESEEWAQTRPKGALRDFLIKWRLLEDTSDRERTIGDICDHFQKRNVKPLTLLVFKQVGKNLIDFFGENKRLRDITPLDATEFEHYLYTAARKKGGNDTAGAGLSRATVRKRIQRVRQYYIEAQRLKWADSNPFEGLEGGNTVNQSRWEYIPRETVLEVMANCTNLEIRARIALMRFAGCRGESEFKCLEWNADWIRWSADGKQGTVRLHRTKTENSGAYADTILPMDTELEKALRDLYDSVPAGTVKVFTPRANPGVMVKKQFRRNGFEIKNTYNLRKSFCRDLMEAGLDWKCYEYYSGHSLQVAMKHYQSWDELRAQKAAPKLLEALQGTNAGTQFGTHQVHNLVHSNNSQYIAVPNEKDDLSVEKIGLSLENRDCCKKLKTPCEILQGDKEKFRIAAQGLEQDAKDPQKQGLFDNADRAGTQFGTHLNYFEQILTLFDRLTPDEQTALLDALKERAPAV